MENLFGALILASFVLLVIGLFKPKTSLFWYKKERTRIKSFLIYLVLTIIFFVLFGVSTDIEDKNGETTKTNKIEKQLTQAQKDSIAIVKAKEDNFRKIEQVKQKELEREQEIENRKSNTISARDLVSSYAANEVRADENFKGKRFFVTGKVTDIKKDLFGEIYVTLEGSEMFREVQCYFDDSKTASKLNKGMRVTFHGECDGLIMNVLMKDCKLVKNLKDL